MQKTKWYLSIAVASLLTGCSPSKSPEISAQPDSADIVGGVDSRVSSVPARSVVLVYDQITHSNCTGTIIQGNIILTAAHCVSENADDVTIAFGINPLTGKYQTRATQKMVVHESADLAMISFVGTLPDGYTPAQLPPDAFQFSVGSQFFAVGYGATSGMAPKGPQDTQGVGILRDVRLRVFSFSDDGTAFKVDQTDAHGICTGDSGGPALITRQNAVYVVGIASALLWTTPEGLTNDQQQQYMANKDLCQEKSLYMNLKNFASWIKVKSQELL